MSLRFGEHYCGGVYHVFNRGTDKRTIFEDQGDKDRFSLLLRLLNSTQNVSSVRDVLEEGDVESKIQEYAQSPLVHIIAFTLQGNHYHLLLEQVADNGLPQFMQKLGIAYTKYFNDKHKRSGVLFQGKYKSVIADNQHKIMRLIAYINRNEEMHNGTHETNYSSRSWYVSDGHPKYLIKYKNMFGDYEKQEQEVIKRIKQERGIDYKFDKDNLLE